jgi:hypothetical protein
MFLCLNFDVPCLSFHQYGRRLKIKIKICSYLNFDVVSLSFFS